MKFCVYFHHFRDTAVQRYVGIITRRPGYGERNGWVKSFCYITCIFSIQYCYLNIAFTNSHGISRTEKDGPAALRNTSR